MFRFCFDMRGADSGDSERYERVKQNSGICLEMYTIWFSNRFKVFRFFRF